MSNDNIKDFKSSVFDEVYLHQGFLSSVSNILDSCDEVKKQQLSPLVTEQQRRINKALGLIYSFFRTVESFNELEEQIKQLVGEDLANAFIMNTSSNVEVAESDSQSVVQNDLNQEVSANVEDVSSDVISENDELVPVEDVATDGVSSEVVVDNDQAIAQNDNGANDFVLSPIEEGVAVESSNISSEGENVIENEGTSESIPDVVAVVESAPETYEGGVQEAVNAPSDNIVSAPARYTRTGQGQVRAILVTSGQSSKLSASKESQKALLVNEAKEQTNLAQGENTVSGDTQIDSVNVQAQVQNLMAQASQAYAAGKAEEAQMYMNQASELNKVLQPNQSSQPEQSGQTIQTDGGVAFVKK